MNKIVLIAVTLVLGMGLGAGVDRGLMAGAHSSVAAEAGADGNSPSAPSPIAAATSMGASVTLDVEPIRAMLREELAAALSRSQMSTASRAVSDEPQTVVVSAQQQREALQGVDVLVNSGHWGNEERMSLQQKLAFMTAQQREQAMQEVVQAVSSGNLKLTDGRVF